jgi:hypothetical protein
LRNHFSYRIEVNVILYKKWRENRFQDEEYRKQHNERSREWLKKKYAENEVYRERQKELARQRYYKRKEMKALEKHTE